MARLTLKGYLGLINYLKEFVIMGSYATLTVTADRRRNTRCSLFAGKRFTTYRLEFRDSLSARASTADRMRHIICAGSDGHNTARQITRIATGWRLRSIAEPLIVCTRAQTPEESKHPR